MHGAVDRDIGVQRQKFRHASGMIRFGVIHYQAVNFGKADNTLNIFQIFIKKIRMYRVNQNILFPGDQICIVACPKLRFHNNIENAQAGIQNANRVNIFF